DVRRRAVTALAVFNDAIIREALTAGVPLCDLRLICTAEADYANPIEPSVVGGAKIAAAIARAVCEPACTRGRPHGFIQDTLTGRPPHRGTTRGAAVATPACSRREAPEALMRQTGDPLRTGPAP